MAIGEGKVRVVGYIDKDVVAVLDRVASEMEVSRGRKGDRLLNLRMYLVTATGKNDRPGHVRGPGSGGV